MNQNSGNLKEMFKGLAVVVLLGIGTIWMLGNATALADDNIEKSVAHKEAELDIALSKYHVKRIVLEKDIYEEALKVLERRCEQTTLSDPVTIIPAVSDLTRMTDCPDYYIIKSKIREGVIVLEE